MRRKKIKTIRQSELVEAAIVAIHEHGFAALTVNSIAETADTSTGSIHYYFGGKDALLEAAMRHLLQILNGVTLKRLKDKTSPMQRLTAIVSSNFDDKFFTNQNCSVWTQFWAYAPYTPSLKRLQELNKSRVSSNLRHELKQILEPQFVETVRMAIQAYMDGVWVQSAQASFLAEPSKIRREAAVVIEVLIENNR